MPLLFMSHKILCLALCSTRAVLIFDNYISSHFMPLSSQIAFRVILSTFPNWCSTDIFINYRNHPWTYRLHRHLPISHISSQATSRQKLPFPCFPYDPLLTLVVHARNFTHLSSCHSSHSVKVGHRFPARDQVQPHACTAPCTAPCIWPLPSACGLPCVLPLEFYFRVEIWL